jgi:hypothetical protein
MRRAVALPKAFGLLRGVILLPGRVLAGPHRT